VRQPSWPRRSAIRFGRSTTCKTRSTSGRVFRTLNVIDERNREGLAIEVDTSRPAARVIRVMEQLAELRGLPAAIRLDHGPELRSQAFTDWCAAQQVELRFIQRASPPMKDGLPRCIDGAF